MTDSNKVDEGRLEITRDGSGFQAKFVTSRSDQEYQEHRPHPRHIEDEEALKAYLVQRGVCKEDADKAVEELRRETTISFPNATLLLEPRQDEKS